MTADELRQKICSKMLEADVVVQSDDDVHFQATVTSNLFEGKSKLKQQQIVYAALGDAFQSGAIHALELKTMTRKNNG